MILLSEALVHAESLILVNIEYLHQRMAVIACIQGKIIVETQPLSFEAQTVVASRAVALPGFQLKEGEVLGTLQLGLKTGSN